jgi:hypothetical protein
MTTPSFDPVAYLLAQLNLINPDALLALSTSNVTISTPTPTDEAAAMDSVAPAINTTATLTAVTGQGFSSTAQFYYQRLNPFAYMVALGNTGALTIPSAGVTDWPSFFTVFNATYGTDFTAIDYPTTPYSLPDDGLLTVTMAATSLLFVGSMMVTVAAASPTPVPSPSPSPTPTPTPTPSPPPTPSLGSVIHVTSLTGLIPPVSLSAMLTQRVVAPGLTLNQLKGIVELSSFIANPVIGVGLTADQLNHVATLASFIPSPIISSGLTLDQLGHVN